MSNAGLASFIKCMADWLRADPSRHSKDFYWRDENNIPLAPFADELPNMRSACLSGIAKKLDIELHTHFELDALHEISRTLGATGWVEAVNFNNAKTTTPAMLIDVLDRTATRLTPPAKRFLDWLWRGFNTPA